MDFKLSTFSFYYSLLQILQFNSENVEKHFEN